MIEMWLFIAHTQHCMCRRHHYPGKPLGKTHAVNCFISFTHISNRCEECQAFAIEAFAFHWYNIENDKNGNDDKIKMTPIYWSLFEYGSHRDADWPFPIQICINRLNSKVPMKWDHLISVFDGYWYWAVILFSLSLSLSLSVWWLFEATHQNSINLWPYQMLIEFYARGCTLSTQLITNFAKNNIKKFHSFDLELTFQLSIRTNIRV